MSVWDRTHDSEMLARFAVHLDAGGAFQPARRSPEKTAARLPGRVPGEALESLASHQSEAMPPGPRSVILDCGASRIDGYTHVLWVAPTAEVTLGSAGYERLGEIVGRVLGVLGYQWEGIERLHVNAPGIAWEDLLAESRDALGVFMAGRN